jgi:hypothetical protein
MKNNKSMYIHKGGKQKKKFNLLNLITLLLIIGFIIVIILAIINP